MSLSVAKRPPGIFNLAVIVAALGYFVDIYDLLLFTIVKKESLLHVGSTDATMLADSSKVINWQMIGLLIGGIAWACWQIKKAGFLCFLAPSSSIPQPISLLLLFIP